MSKLDETVDSEEIKYEINENAQTKEQQKEEKKKQKEEKKQKKLQEKQEKFEKKKLEGIAEEEMASEADEISEGEESGDENHSDLSGHTDRKERKKKKKQKKEEEKPEDINIVKELLSLIVYIGAVVLVCYLILTFVGCRSRVDGSSMYPTLSDNDSVWVDKLSYTFGDPKRFDVIVFDYSDDETYVKRIIGLPGERVRIDVDGSIYINDQLLLEDYGKEPIQPNNIGRASQDVQLGDDEYFVLGDNRNNSSDSRWADVGNVERDKIVGKVLLRIYPFSDFGKVK